MTNVIKNFDELDNLYQDLVKRYENCDFAFIPLNKLDLREKKYFKTFMPEAKTVIVVYHQVKNLKDWIWTCPDGGISSQRCNINDWSNEVCDHVEKTLMKNDIHSITIPYPDEIGLQFRSVAVALGYGEIGKNAFYLHPEWGSKVHLRIMALDITGPSLCSIKVKTDEVCLNCFECIKKCPAQAYENGFNGLKCREFREKRGEYIPTGPEGILRSCQKCMAVCKAGKD